MYSAHRLSDLHFNAIQNLNSLSDKILQELLVLRKILTIFIAIARLCNSCRGTRTTLAVVRISVDSHPRPDVVFPTEKPDAVDSYLKPFVRSVPTAHIKGFDQWQTARGEP